MWTTEYIISQIFVVFAIALFVTSAYLKNRKAVILLNCFVNLCYGIQYILLQKYTGVIINAIGILRSIWFYFDTKFNKKDYISLFACIILSICGTVFTYSSWQDIIALIGSLIFTYGVWQSNLQIYRLLAIINHICFIFYNIFCKSYISLAFEILIIILTTISIIKFYIEEKKSKNINNFEEINKK